MNIQAKRLAEDLPKEGGISQVSVSAARLSARAHEHMAEASSLLNRISQAVDGNPLLAGIIRNASTARVMANQMKETPSSLKRSNFKKDEKQNSTDRR